MKKNLIIIPIILMILFAGCSQVELQQTNYYILEYYQGFEDNSLVRKSPIDAKIMIMDAHIPKTYSRNQIVSRTSKYKLSYLNHDLWSNKLSKSVPGIISKKFKNYNLFTESSQNFVTDAEYSLITNINSIEFLEYEGQYSAHLNFELILRNNGSNEVKARYATDRQKVIPIRNIEQFVQTINELIMDETDIFVTLIEKSFEQNTSINEKFTKDKNEELDIYSQSNDLINKGKLYIPAKTEAKLEPQVKVSHRNGAFVGAYSTGEDILLDPGNYDIEFGSGQYWQKIKKEVSIKKGYRLIINPDWAWLKVNVIDENRTSLDVRYELFEIETSSSLGMKTGANEEIGEKIETWVLKPGSYKITVNGTSFNTYVDFATVELSPNKLTEITIVLDSETERLVGAGKIHGSSVGNLFSSKYWKISSAMHANASMTSDNDASEKDFQTNIDLSTQLDSRITYDKFPYNFVSTDLIEFGTSKSPDSDFEISLDNLDSKNTFVYYFSEKYGVYTRVDMNTHFFGKKVYFDQKSNYALINTENDTTYYEDEDYIQVKPSLFPVYLKEGFGANLRLLNSSKYKLHFRSGFGLRQDFNKEVYAAQEQTVSHDGSEYSIYSEIETLYSKGLEFSVVSSFQLFKNVTYSSNIDALIPFEKGLSNNYEWENLVNIKLFKYISLDYKLNMKYNEDVIDYTNMNHNLFLRFTYLLY
ncbi:MAG: hypothetical protein U9N34_04085 [Candidatus Cloacimonadota bacterium]|nr:hypothetical protein [Candidatus Cloacimonadota bacterium]